jgi:hypothetical protein
MPPQLTRPAPMQMAGPMPPPTHQVPTHQMPTHQIPVAPNQQTAWVAAPAQQPPWGAPPTQPAPVQPGAVTQRRLRPISEFPPIDPGGAVQCRTCGIGNDDTRRFCRRCGNPLDAAPVERLSWWRRLLRWLKGLFKREPRQAGYRPRRRGGIRPGGVVLTGLLAIALVVGFTPALRTRAVNGVVDGYNAVRDKMKDPVVAASRNPGASSSAAGNEPRLINDAGTDTFWAPAKAAPAEGEWVQVELEDPARIVSIIIHSGSSPDRPTFLTQARPRQVEVVLFARGSDSKDKVVTTKTVDLADRPGAQTFTIKGSDVSAVRLTIRSAYGAESGRRVAIAELELFVRP